jgi:hypothetical protein
MESRRMRWAVHVARIEEEINVYWVLVGSLKEGLIVDGTTMLNLVFTK